MSAFHRSFPVFLFVLVITPMTVLHGQIRPPHEDESKVTPYTVPDVLIGEDGKKITSKDQWPAHREYLLRLLAEKEYGFAATNASRSPEPVETKVQVIEEGITPSGKAKRKQLEVTWTRRGKSIRVDLLVYVPVDAKEPVPVFLSLNFQGNHATSEDPAIRLTKSWVSEKSTNHQATEDGRGKESQRYPIDAIVARGYGVATAYYGDIDPDFDDGFENGIHALFPEYRSSAEHPNRWGSIAGWAWGLSRLADVLQQQKDIDPQGLMVLGHSRLGKTALWAGATDPRFQIVISNNSGCGGAALSKRNFGETVARINTSFPHWFCYNFRQYNDQEEKLEFDQHFLIASIAPRPVYIASASEDLWADPKGEYLGGWYASSVYELLGYKGLPSDQVPAAEQVVGDRIGYHLRSGKHELLEYDWQRYMDFADRHLP